ncbi:response regulator transcription factor [Hyphomicrobium methylovorum]|uniref:response regulator transcription factor n=1 Tax=Hyphomicrobium methylovorum TaxID=84 RepID=UPI0015E7B1A3|nr:helix-turn-helix transcriptional regulator [Hyphomicrobium methylovorum]
MLLAVVQFAAEADGIEKVAMSATVLTPIKNDVHGLKRGTKFIFLPRYSTNVSLIGPRIPGAPVVFPRRRARFARNICSFIFLLEKLLQPIGVPIRTRNIHNLGVAPDLESAKLSYICCMRIFICAMPMDDILNPAKASVLTQRETQCVQALAHGLSNSEIAKELHIALPTVAMHLSNARHKLGAKTREHAVALAIADGLVAPPSQD